MGSATKRSPGKREGAHIICDVPHCPEPAREAAMGHLCQEHGIRFEEAIRDDQVFLTEVFLGAKSAEDDELARQECYSRWLGEVARATA